MKKILAISLIFVLCLLSGCQKKVDTPEITGLVEVIYNEQKIVSEVVTTHCDNAEDVLLEVCQKNKTPYQLNDHMFNGFGGYASTETDGWILYVNDEIADKGAYEMKLENDFKVVFSYVNYDEVFFAE
ncbi:MAG: DUF4430 domain-containing protein [Ruminococcaceae bacterium]|nr:DUF4430 domain-containing protein [Oscillospiraceae bacterium]